MSNGNKLHWKARTLELEEILEVVHRALTLVPVRDIQQGCQWMPSEEALRLLDRAKVSVRDYAEEHWGQ